VFRAPGSGVAMAMYNLDDSIRDFARASMNYALGALSALSLDQEHILKAYDGRFKDLFQEVFDAEFAGKIQNRRITYEHRLIDTWWRARSNGAALCLGLQDYDGDVQSDTVAQGFARSADDIRSDDAGRQDGGSGSGTRTVTRHYREHQKGKATSTNSIASIFAWTRGLAHRAKLDSNERLAKFADTLEKSASTRWKRLHDERLGALDRPTALADHRRLPRQGDENLKKAMG